MCESSSVSPSASLLRSCCRRFWYREVVFVRMLLNSPDMMLIWRVSDYHSDLPRPALCLCNCGSLVLGGGCTCYRVGRCTCFQLTRRLAFALPKRALHATTCTQHYCPLPRPL